MISQLAIEHFTPSADKIIWDVRDADNYNNGHILHAINQPLKTLTKDLLDNTTGDIYVLCGGGTKAVKACDILEALDPSRTYIHLTGGTR